MLALPGGFSGPAGSRPCGRLPAAGSLGAGAGSDGPVRGGTVFGGHDVVPRDAEAEPGCDCRRTQETSEGERGFTDRRGAEESADGDDAGEQAGSLDPEPVANS
jgi:hypothetical protein